jgi:uncharacterized protein (TIGR00266 family)
MSPPAHPGIVSSKYGASSWCCPRHRREEEQPIQQVLPLDEHRAGKYNGPQSMLLTKPEKERIMRYTVQGTTMPTLDLTLEAGESIFTEKGGMAWMSGDIAMDTNARGGLLSGIGRRLAGESFFLTTYRCNSGQALVTFTPEAPGTILPFELRSGQALICQKDSFMCAQETVGLEMHFRQRLGSGLFGGEGFILQKLSGPGTAFVEITGEVREYTLEPGQSMRVDPGHIAIFEPSVKYDIQRVKGVRNILFGGEGLFLARLTGPGHIWLQSMPLANLAAAIHALIPGGK